MDLAAAIVTEGVPGSPRRSSDTAASFVPTYASQDLRRHSKRTHIEVPSRLTACHVSASELFRPPGPPM